MNYFIDSEFYERPGRLDLISIGIVSEDGREYYAENKEAPYVEIERDDWLRENVLPHLFGRYAVLDRGTAQSITFSGTTWKMIPQMRREIQDFVGPDPPMFWSYYGAYDHVAFCWIFGRMIDLPKGWPMYSMDLKQYTKMLRSNVRLTKPESEHNALSDARWNRDLWRILGSPSYTPTPM